MSQPAQPVQKTNGNTGGALVKLALIVAGLIALVFSLITIDVPNRNYLWIVVEIIVAGLLIQAAIGLFRRIFRG